MSDETKNIGLGEPISFSDLLLKKADHYASTNPGLAKYVGGTLRWSAISPPTHGISGYGVLSYKEKLYQAVQSFEGLQVFPFPDDVEVQMLAAKHGDDKALLVIKPFDDSKRCDFCWTYGPTEQHGSWCGAQVVHGIVSLRLIERESKVIHHPGYAQTRRDCFAVIQSGTASDLKSWLEANPLTGWMSDKYKKLDLGAVDFERVLAAFRKDAHVAEAWEELQQKEKASATFTAYLSTGVWDDNKRHLEENLDLAEMEKAYPKRFQEGGLFKDGACLSDDLYTAYKQIDCLRQEGYLENNHHFALLLDVEMYLKGITSGKTKAANALEGYLDDVWKDEKRDLAEKVRWDLEEKHPEVFETLFDCEEDLSWDYPVAFKRAAWLKEHGYFHEHPAFNLLVVAKYLGLE